MSQLIKKQHHIPKFILRRFLDGTNFRIFNKEKARFATKGASNSMVKNWFYEHSDFQANEIEKLLSLRENFYKQVTDKLISGLQLTHQEYRTLIEFRHVTYYRSSEFDAFHNFKKRRGNNDWMSRGDWRSIHGRSFFKPLDKEEIKWTQLNAIKSVINGKDAAFKMSLFIPLCFVFTSNDKKFVIGDAGSLCWGENEFNGMVFLVISPNHVVAFPRVATATNILIQSGIKLRKGSPLVKYEFIDDELVDRINEGIKLSAYEYYIDPD